MKFDKVVLFLAWAAVFIGLLCQVYILGQLVSN